MRQEIVEKAGDGEAFGAGGIGHRSGSMRFGGVCAGNVLDIRPQPRVTMSARAPHCGRSSAPDARPSPSPLTRSEPGLPRRAGFVRRAAAAALVLLLAGALLAGLTPERAHAQGATTLISNLNQSGAINITVGGPNAFRQAIKFTTGGAASYTVSEVVAQFTDAISGVQPVVSIYTVSSSGNPGTVLYTLTNPASLGLGQRTWTAPPNATLDGQTSYFVIFAGSGALPYRVAGTSGDNEDEGGASGWSIADDRHFRLNIGNWDTALLVPKIAVRGTTQLRPGKVTGVTVDRVTANSIRVRWTKPGESSAAPITSFGINTRERNAADTGWGSWVFRASVGASDTSHVVTGLPSGARQQVRVFARAERTGQSILYGANSNYVEFTTAAAPLALSTARVDGTSLTLTYNEALDTGSTPAGGDYIVRVNGSATAVSSVAVSGSAVTLTLATAVTTGQRVTVSYAVPTTNPVQDAAGNDAGALMNRAVVNALTPSRTLTWAGGFTESAANDGSVTGSVTATLTGDTFVVNPQPTVSNVPAGLSAVITRTSATVVTITLTGRATAHADANDVSDLTVAFDTLGSDFEEAFNDRRLPTGLSKPGIAIDFNDPAPRSIAWAGGFTEAVANDGSVTGSVTATLSNDRFAANAVSGNFVSAANVPAGLTAVATRTSDFVVTVTLTGRATNHANANDASNLQVTLFDQAFAGGIGIPASARQRTFAVDFDDPTPPPSRSIAWSGGFTESRANDGSVTGGVTATLTGDTFVVNPQPTVSNVPAGLTAVITRTSLTVVTITLTGRATNHADANDVSDLTVAFGTLGSDFEEAFDDRRLPTGLSKPGIAIDFNDPAPRSIAWAGGFTEAVANDGSVTGSVTATLSNDRFASDVVSASRVSVSNVPAGLTAVATRTGDFVVTVTLTGRATNHANANDASNLQATLFDQAFAGGIGIPASARQRTFAVDFNDPPPPPSRSIAWAGGFTESRANDGSVTGSVTATLTGDTFVVNPQPTVSNVPAGLTAVITRTSLTVVTITLTGRATNHADANDVSDLTVAFDTLGSDFEEAFDDRRLPTGLSKSGIAIDFNDPGTRTLTWAGGFSEAAANDGSVTGSVTATLSNDRFVADVVSASRVSVANVPAGLTAVATRTSNSVVTVALSGRATNHADADDVSNLDVAFFDSV